MPDTTLRQRFSFTSTQKKVLFALASMVGLRMLGLFLVLPVFTLYGLQFTTSKFLVGFAFGAYALVMAILQIPLGRLSDRIGRRKVLVMGMTLVQRGIVPLRAAPLFPALLANLGTDFRAAGAGRGSDHLRGLCHRGRLR